MAAIGDSSVGSNKFLYNHHVLTLFFELNIIMCILTQSMYICVCTYVLTRMCYSLKDVLGADFLSYKFTIFYVIFFVFIIISNGLG